MLDKEVSPKLFLAVPECELGNDTRPSTGSSRAEIAHRIVVLTQAGSV